jgi:hypothetical protein
LFEALPDHVSPERLGGGLPRLRCAERGQTEVLPHFVWSFPIMRR